mgnify:CR=1 FL=1|tara:strand:- start:6130 stop:6627 length:498 start_codon:yes stop_codon:yes gene_type:complete
MRVLKTISIIFLIGFLSCNSTKRDAIEQIENDFSMIQVSRQEIIDNYDYCLSNFSSQRKVGNGFYTFHCIVTSHHSEQLDSSDLEMTKTLVNKGYIITVDAKNRYRIFYRSHTKEYIAGVIKYGLVYSNIENVNDSIYSLNLSGMDTLKSIDKLNQIIELNEYAE